MSTTTTEIERAEERKEFVRLDKLDEAQIIAEMKGEIIEEYFYEFPDRKTGKPRAGLSFAGVKWITREMASAKDGHRTSILHTDIRSSPDGKLWLADSTGQDMETGEKRPGHFAVPMLQPIYEWKSPSNDPNGKKEKVKVGEELDPFGYTVAGSKAERNALRHFIPEPVIKAMYLQWKAKKALPAPAKEDSMAERIAKAKDVTPPSPPHERKDDDVDIPPGAPAPQDAPGNPTPPGFQQIFEDFKTELDSGWVEVEPVENGGVLVRKLRAILPMDMVGLRAKAERKYGGKMVVDGEKGTYWMIPSTS